MRSTSSTPTLSELFGWVVREAVTNVVRHSRAEHCTITLGPRWIEIVDDGRGARRRRRRQRADRPARAARRRRRHVTVRGHAARLAAARRASRAAAPADVAEQPATVDAVDGAVTIRLLLADDQTLVRSALAALLDLEDDFEVVAQVGRGDEVVAAALARPSRRRAARHRDAGHGRAGRGRRADATSCPTCRVIILTTFGRPGYLRRAMESGALGFVVKDAPAEQLADAVRRVRRGERVVDPALAAATLAGGASPLTGRERDVLVAARDGATVADIAGKLFLSEGTVRNYLSAAIAKTGTRNRVEAVRAADERGWL